METPPLIHTVLTQKNFVRGVVYYTYYFDTNNLVVFHRKNW